MKRVLVVDDNLVNRKLASAMLQKRGWRVEEADNGYSALEKLESAAFDYVLLDISMPGIDGEEVCRRIRQMEATQGLHVVAYTAHALESEKARIMSAGFNDIVIKPVTMEALTAKLPD
ncbi:response regulator [Azovibrio restrictus]|uniref:response regulator n=1 Tax=Azovibrio restrictus TaxID=146938 RepID=UPI0026F1CA4B|nr:response regulator [Azovibrio restrictus]